MFSGEFLSANLIWGILEGGLGSKGKCSQEQSKVVPNDCWPRAGEKGWHRGSHPGAGWQEAGGEQQRDWHSWTPLFLSPHCIHSSISRRPCCSLHYQPRPLPLVKPTHHGHQAPLHSGDRGRWVKYPPFLWTYFLSLGQEEMGWQSLNPYFVVLGSTGHLTKGWDKERIVLSLPGRQENRMGQPGLAKAHHPPPITSWCISERRPAQTISGWGKGVLITDVTGHKPSQLVPSSKYLVLSFNCLFPIRVHSRGRVGGCSDSHRRF